MGMTLNILGSASATPTSKNFPTAQLLVIRGRHILIDCGEGTQIQLRKARIKFSRIDQIYLSHLHGDHFYGLPGLLASFNLLQRKKPLQLFAPVGIKAILDTLFEQTDAHLNYPLTIVELSSTLPQVLYEDDKIQVQSLPLDHRIYTNGYLFREKPGLRKLDRAAVARHPEIQFCDYAKFKQGQDFTLESGLRIENKALTQDPPAPLSYAFCSDTAYKPDLADWVRGVTALYHESTFLERDAALADKTRHSTPRQAARCALEAGAHLLLLGHFSARYDDWQAFQVEAETLFRPVRLARPGDTLSLGR